MTHRPNDSSYEAKHNTQTNSEVKLFQTFDRMCTLECQGCEKIMTQGTPNQVATSIPWGIHVIAVCKNPDLGSFESDGHLRLDI
jgi:hypothetical protein